MLMSSQLTINLTAGDEGLFIHQGTHDYMYQHVKVYMTLFGGGRGGMMVHVSIDFKIC